MKTIFIILIFVFTTSTPFRLRAQSFEVQQLILDLEKLSQLKSILADLYKGYEIVSKGYSAIKNISEGNFNLHQLFLEGLLQVSPAVQKYQRVADIISGQVQLVKEYKVAFNRFKAAGNFSIGEVQFIGGVYARLFAQTTKELDDLITIVTAGNLRMNDEERLKQIDSIYGQLESELAFLRYFNSSTALLSIQRTKEQTDVNVSRKLFQISH